MGLLNRAVGIIACCALVQVCPVTAQARQAEYDATMETLHLMRSRRNATRLREAIADVEAGEVVSADLIDGAVEERR